MTESPARTRAAVRAQYRAALIARIASRFADGALVDLPDVFLIIVNRALDRDLSGIHEFSRHTGYRALPAEKEVTHE